MHEPEQRPTDIETMCDKISQTTNMTSPRSTDLHHPHPVFSRCCCCCFFFFFFFNLNFLREDKRSTHVCPLCCPDSHLHNFGPGSRPAQLHTSMLNTGFFLHMNFKLIEEGALLINLLFQETYGNRLASPQSITISEPTCTLMRTAIMTAHLASAVLCKHS